MMSAFRFVRRLRQEDFLDSDSEILRLVRREELMHRWQAAHLRPAPELPLRWIAVSGQGGHCRRGVRLAVAARS